MNILRHDGEGGLNRNELILGLSRQALYSLRYHPHLRRISDRYITSPIVRIAFLSNPQQIKSCFAYPVDEISSLETPSLRDLVLLDLDLLHQDLVADLLSGSAEVGSSAHHELVGNDSEREVVDLAF